MLEKTRNTIIYSIWDPTGNITALVESPTEIERQPQVAAALMRACPEVEQVGFVKVWKKDAASLPAGMAGGRCDGAGDGGQSDRVGDDRQSDSKIEAELRMAGGEFCGNASLCTAAWYLSRESEICFGGQAGAATILEALGGGPPKKVSLKVSGAEEIIEVTLTPQGESDYEGSVKMPPARAVNRREFAYGGLRENLPVVEMEGISHMIIEPESAFASLANDRAAAEEAVRLWCAELGADGLGLMFLEEGRTKARGQVKAAAEKPDFRLTPLVYIPGSGTVFWESSCASGTAAAGMYLAARTDGRDDLRFEEPGGFLRVTSDQAGHKTCLCGRVRLLLRDSLKL